MLYDPNRHHRRSIRLRGYDYSQAGVYLVTICTQGRLCCFGDIVDGQMHLNGAGHMIWAEWHTLLTRFPAVELDEFVVMPNHAHGIVWIVGTTTHGATTRVAPTLGDVIGAFKSITTGGYIRGVTDHDWSPFPGRLRQRNYYEQIIRNNKALDGIRQYILDNPAHWAEDAENPEKERR